MSQNVPAGSSANLTIDIDKIELLEEWNRKKVSGLREMKASIVAKGQLVPLLVKPSANEGRVVVVDGRRRLAALLELNVRDVLISLCTDEGEDAGESLLTSMVTNLVREDNTPFEIARSFDLLVTKYGKSNEEIAKSCGKTAGYVSQHRAVMKSSKELQDALEKGLVPLAAFRLFSRLSQDEDAKAYKKLQDAMIAGRIGCAQLEERIKEYLDKKGAPVSKKGAAAHKKNKEAAAAIHIPDYSDKEVIAAVKARKKDYMLDWLSHTGELLRGATRKSDRTYLQGKLDGMELFASLQDEER